MKKSIVKKGAGTYHGAVVGLVVVFTVGVVVAVPCGDVVVTTVPLFPLITGVCATPVVVSTERVTFPFGVEVTPFVSCFPSL